MSGVVGRIFEFSYSSTPLHGRRHHAHSQSRIPQQQHGNLPSIDWLMSCHEDNVVPVLLLLPPALPLSLGAQSSCWSGCSKPVATAGASATTGTMKQLLLQQLKAPGRCLRKQVAWGGGGSSGAGRV